MRRSALVAALVVAGAVLAPAGAVADGTYSSPPIILEPVDGTSGGHGQVENVHANGPVVYAHEQYQLRGARPGTSYLVTLRIYVGDPSCATTPAVLTAATLTTNGAGNAAGKRVFTPDEAAGLPKNVPHGIVWTMSAGAGATYRSGCEAVVLD